MARRATHSLLLQGMPGAATMQQAGGKMLLHSSKDFVPAVKDINNQHG